MELIHFFLQQLDWGIPYYFSTLVACLVYSLTGISYSSRLFPSPQGQAPATLTATTTPTQTDTPPAPLMNRDPARARAKGEIERLIHENEGRIESESFIKRK